jgi:hypothetical protein
VCFGLWIFHPSRKRIPTQFHADEIKLPVIIVRDHHAHRLTGRPHKNNGLALPSPVTFLDEGFPL